MRLSYEALAHWLSEQLLEPMPLYPLLLASLKDCDDGHAVTAAGSKPIAQEVLRRSRAAVHEFLSISTTFALNVWMALAACVLARAEHMQTSSIVSRAGGNGVEFGIQIASTPGKWVTVRAAQPVGALDPAHSGRTVAHAVGDSAVFDFLGLGAQAIDRTSPVYCGLQRFLPTDFVREAATYTEYDAYTFDRRRAAVDARRAATAKRGPLVLLGMLDEAGEAGRIGAGFVDVSATVFERALEQVAGVPG